MTCRKYGSNGMTAFFYNRGDSDSSEVERLKTGNKRLIEENEKLKQRIEELKKELARGDE